ncbi:MAG: signal recognition particle protein [Spirochaetales bacterium]
MFDGLTTKFSDILRSLSGKGAITEKNVQDMVEEIKVALIEADVNLRVVRRFINQTLEEAKGSLVVRSVNPGQQFVKILHDKMVKLLGDVKTDLTLRGPDTVSTILLLGLQGAGKTTTVAKLAARLKKQGRKVLLVAADLQRPAAIDQLSILGTSIEVEVYRESTKNPVDVVKNALKHAKKNLFDTVIVDTAGRLQIDTGLMDELVQIKKAADPVECLLVADAMTGQNAVEIAQAFDEKVGITGIILTKFDSDTRGGAALSLKTITGKPIVFVGMGEKIENLDVFYPERFASRILGMGDVVSLVEKAQENFDATEALGLQQKMAGGTFTLEDYLEQFRKVRKMGSMQQLVAMVPGLAGQVDAGAIDEGAIKKEEAIILSMTKKERKNPLILGPVRRKRIANGSGTSIFDVNQLLKKFEKTKLMMKKVARNKGMQNQMMQQFGGMK